MEWVWCASFAACPTNEKRGLLIGRLKFASGLCRLAQVGHYMEPINLSRKSSKNSGVFEKLPSCSIPLHEITFTNVILGTGAQGDVLLGNYQKKLVAIKTLVKQGETNLEELLKEVVLMQ